MDAGSQEACVCWCVCVCIRVQAGGHRNRFSSEYIATVVESLFAPFK